MRPLRPRIWAEISTACLGTRRIELEPPDAGLETEIGKHAGPANRAQKMRVLKALDEPALNQRKAIYRPIARR